MFESPVDARGLLSLSSPAAAAVEWAHNERLAAALYVQAGKLGNLDELYE